MKNVRKNLHHENPAALASSSSNHLDYGWDTLSSEYCFEVVLGEVCIKCGLSVLCVGTFPTWDTLSYYLLLRAHLKGPCGVLL